MSRLERVGGARKQRRARPRRHGLPVGRGACAAASAASTSAALASATVADDVASVGGIEHRHARSRRRALSPLASIGAALPVEAASAANSARQRGERCSFAEVDAGTSCAAPAPKRSRGSGISGCGAPGGVSRRLRDRVLDQLVDAARPRRRCG